MDRKGYFNLGCQLCFGKTKTQRIFLMFYIRLNIIIKMINQLLALTSYLFRPVQDLIIVH
jgi:hypothetical protein